MVVANAGAVVVAVAVVVANTDTVVVAAVVDVVVTIAVIAVLQARGENSFESQFLKTIQTVQIKKNVCEVDFPILPSPTRNGTISAELTLQQRQSTNFL